MKKCPACAEEIQDEAIKCRYCGEWFKKDGGAHKEKIPVTLANVKYFNTSIVKLIVLSICTLGIYEIYWHYKNWKAIKDQTGEDISPFWRAWFKIFTCYELFKRIKTSVESKEFSFTHSAGLLATLYILFMVCGFGSWQRYNNAFTNIVWFVSFLSIIPLCIIQNYVNLYNDKIDQSYQINNVFSWKTIAIIVIGGFILMLAILGTLLPK